MKYVMISFYLWQRVDGDFWVLYGWRGAGDGDFIDEFTDKAVAIDKAFSFGVPVVWNQNADYFAAKLENPTRR